MIVYKTEIAGIVFHTRSAIRIPLLENQIYGRFQASEAAPDIIQHIHFIKLSAGEATAPSRRAAALSHAIYTPLQTSRANVTIFPRSFTPITKTYASGLLANRQIRKHIATCSTHPDDAYVIWHSLFFEIRDFRGRRLDIFYPREALKLLLLDHAQNGIQRMFSIFLPTLSSLMIHSSAVALDGRAACFVAPSGGGKSTLARLAPRKTILCDDHNIIRLSGQGPEIAAAAWGKVIGTTRPLPLGAIFVLKKGAAFSLRPLDRKSVIAGIWNDNLPLWNNLPPQWRLRALDLLGAICAAVPLYELGFQRRQVDWKKVSQAMRSGEPGAKSG